LISYVKGRTELSVFRNMVLRKIFEPKMVEGQEAGDSCIMRSFMTFTSHQKLFR
jgi:hypothetical protein